MGTPKRTLKVTPKSPVKRSRKKTQPTLADLQAEVRRGRRKIAELTQALQALQNGTTPPGESAAYDTPDRPESPAPGYPPTTQDIKDLAAELLQNPDLWFNSPNPRFHGRKPADMLGTEDEIRLYWALRAFEMGTF